jgi:P27 family predicted phage terminase small subunit
MAVISKTPAPEHLSAAAQALWDRMIGLYDIDTAAEVVLQTLCEAFDRRTEAREQIVKDGVYIRDRFNVIKSHPGIAVERDAGLCMQRAWKLLGFDQSAPKQGELFSSL